MSDEQREQGRDAHAPADAPHTDQYPTTNTPDPTRTWGPAPPYPAGPGTPGHPQNHGPQSHGPGYGNQSYGTQSHGSHGPATAAPPRPRRMMTGIVTAALIAGLVGGGAGFGGAYLLLGDGSGPQALTTAPSTPAASTTPGTVAGAAAVATPSTVDIRLTTAQGAAEGSGVVLTEDGAVLTNNHVVGAAGGGEITVTLADGTEHPATVVGSAPSYDLAVLQVQDVSGLTPATLGNSADLQVGQQVVAIGSPRGLTGTVTTGIVSAIDRTVTVQGEDGSAVVYNGMQTDAPINQGNSGGPLVDLQGRVVGINSAIATTGESTGSIGLGFAIPVDQAKRVSQEILDTGTATKPVLGVQGDPTAADGSGAQVGAITEGSAAADAGLAAGDVVTRVDDARVQDFTDLIARIGAQTPGDTVTLTVSSGGTERTVDVTLGSTPDAAATTTGGGEQQSPFGGGSPFGSPFGN